MHLFSKGAFIDLSKDGVIISYFIWTKNCLTTGSMLCPKFKDAIINVIKGCRVLYQWDSNYLTYTDITEIP